MSTEHSTIEGMTTRFNPYTGTETESAWVTHHPLGRVVLNPYIADEMLAAREEVAVQAAHRLTRMLSVVPVAAFAASVLLAHLLLSPHTSLLVTSLTGVLFGAALALATQVVLEAWPVHAIRMSNLTREIDDAELWGMRLRSTGGIGNQPANVLFNLPAAMRPSVIEYLAERGFQARDAEVAARLVDDGTELSLGQVVEISLSLR